MSTAFRFATLLLAASASGALAQSPPGAGELAAGHALLQRFVGEWEAASECSTGPDTPPMKTTGDFSSRSLGGRWVVNRMVVEAGPTTVTGVQTLGYDAEKGKYVGTWVDSMIDHLWVYEGDYDPATQKLTLNTTGPDVMAGGGTVRYRDIYRFIDDDHIESSSEALGDDGQWVTFTTGHLRRKAE